MITGTEALSVGITWAFAPVCDLDLEPKNPIVQTRAFGADPVRVGEQAAVSIRGLQDHGVLGCAKHYPGHGRTTEDSHATLPRVRAAGTDLQQVDAAPFEHALRAGVGSVMSAFVAYPDCDPTGRAASFSPAILGHLRDALTFGGLVVTDAVVMAAASARPAMQRHRSAPPPPRRATRPSLCRSSMTTWVARTRSERGISSRACCRMPASQSGNGKRETGNAWFSSTPSRARGKGGPISARAPARPCGVSCRG